MAGRSEITSPRGLGPFVLLFALALGATAVVAQSIWIRELSLLWFGSELCWGMTLSAWLGGVAVGAAACGLLSRRIRPTVLATACSLALAATLPAGLWVLRSARSLLGTGAGEFIPTPQMLALTAATAGVTGLWVGALFPAGCALAGKVFDSPRRAIGIFFLTEAAGTLVAGVAFTFWWVERLDPFTLSAALSAGLLAMVGAACAVRRGALNVCCGFLAALAGVALIVAGYCGLPERLERDSQDGRWADLFDARDRRAVLSHVGGAESRFGRIDLGESRGQWTLYLNCRPAATFPNRSALAPWVHLAASQCPQLRRVLVIGQATGELSAELGRYPGVEVEAVELDKKVHDILAAHVVPAPAAPTDFADGRRHVKASPRKYDLILLAVGDPTSITAARFYTPEFFGEAKQRLTDDGVLAFSLAGPAGEISPQLRDYLGSVYRSARGVFPEMLWTWGDPVHAFLARRPGVLTAEPEELVARYKRHGGPATFDPDWFLGWRQDRLQGERLKRLAAALEGTPPNRANTDARPVAMFLHLLRQEHALLSLEGGPAGPRRRSLLAVLARARLWHALAAIGVVSAVVCAAVALRGRKQRRGGGVGRLPILFSLATTGLAGIALEVVLLAAFQTLYGYVYSHIAVIVAAYMAGVAAGSLLHSRKSFPSPRRAWRRLVLLDVALCLGCLATPWLLGLLGKVPAAPAALIAIEWTILAMVAAVGLAGGMVVPLAAGLYRAGPEAGTGQVAGAVDAADCLGGAVGAVACGLVLLPLLGWSAACGALALLKLGAVAALLLARPER